ncbi:MAG: transcriptional regulator NrdR [Pseudomonadota bacterium]
MKCPFCQEPDTKVIDSRMSKEGAIIRRRRECEKCVQRFTTYERVEEPLPMIIKKDGRREAYDRLKIIVGIKKACEKRPVSMQTIEELVDRIERWVQDKGEVELKSTVIGEEVMSQLKDLDQVAYVRFASVYRSFKDIGEFMERLKDIFDEENEKK